MSGDHEKETIPLTDIWSSYRRAFADEPITYVVAAREAHAKGDAPLARDLIAHAVRLFPQDRDAALMNGQFALDEKEWLKASKIYEDIREHHPEEPIGYVFGGWAYWAAGLFDQADELLRCAIKKYPDDPWAAIHYAWSALHRPDWPEAARRYGDVRDRFPDQPSGYVDGGWALREAGHAVAADTVLREAVQRFPENPIAWFHYARNASSLARWQEAVDRWEMCRSRLPDDPVWHLESKASHYNLQFHLSEDNLVFSPKISLISDANMLPSDMLAMFESLGDNCDFGLMQRYLGAEPLGLLRFGYVPSLDYLLRALENEFEGVGDPINLSIELSHQNEYMINSNRAFTAMHSGIYDKANLSADDVLRQLAPRLRYMSRRIVESLKAASKIWVYKQYERISAADVERLHAALRRYNKDNCLLCIRLPEPGHDEGSVVMHSERVAIGHLLYTKFTLLEQPPRQQAWLEVCRAALRCMPLEETAVAS